jgi:Zn-dependent peptidase ImmA (M78 family)
VFANTHACVWFRRNFILLHEVAHLLFDATSAGASVDFSDGDPSVDTVAEARANAFAQDLLVPADVIRHVAQQRGVRWDALTAVDLAHLVADTQVEAQLVVKAALEAGLLSADAAAAASALDLEEILPTITERALDAVRYFERHPETKGQLEKRNTTIPSMSLRLPSGYVKNVVEAVRRGAMNWTKGAELLMIDRTTFRDRFPEAVPAE